MPPQDTQSSAVKTEAVTNPICVLPQVVSPALYELAPMSVELVDARRKPVPLSSAGHVLLPGRKYYLVLSFARDSAPKRVRLATPPDFIKTADRETPPRPGSNDPCIYEIQFRVDRNLRTFDLEADELDIEYTFGQKSGKPPQLIRLPIVIRPGIWFLLLSVVAGLLAFCVPVLINDLLAKPEDVADLNKYRSLIYNPIPYILTGLILVGVAVVYLYVFWQLRRRTSDLHTRFLEEFAVSPKQSPGDEIEHSNDAEE